MNVYFIRLSCFTSSYFVKTHSCSLYLSKRLLVKDFNILDYDNSAVDLIILELQFWARNATIRLENEKLKKTSNLRNFT